ncbi:hypothetical protein [Ktedonospora formicarum]|uniref:Uncharacterized protein n=1 Tax=Ktedonospora formicarum TaxID=2778364 RepID=A0A8J3I5S3_9CHLR|nr:hypothetical protein [Ktedonospora formicarum]GHO45904.1 hypothetical protein KSX_40670 [Ktedonospora formicarum]
MSRPRLASEQKKKSFSLAFSPNLIAALEKVRGAKSQSVFVEEWLRQQPQIAAELVAMNDPGFVPPIAHYEQLMQYLLKFYSPGDGGQPSLARTLFIALKVIKRNSISQDQDIEGQIVTAMEAFWLQERRKQGTSHARGENMEAVKPAIQDYARYYYQEIFQNMAQGDYKLLQHRFRSLLHGCEAVYQERLKRTFEH